MDSEANLSQRLRKAERRGQLRAYALIAPLFIFVALSFLIPLGTVLLNSFYDPVVPNGLPRTVRALADWNGPRDQIPPEPVYAALAQDLKEAVQAEKHGSIANRLNVEESGLRTVFMRAARRVSAQEDGPWAPFFEAADPGWAQPGIWGTIRNLASPTHSLFYLSALDAKRNQDGSVGPQPEDQRIHITIYLRTLGVALTVTLMCILLGFPLAYLLAHLRDKTANLLLILVLLPFWTSLLVRTTAWMVVLQKEGVINSLLQALHLISEPLPLVFNRFGVVVAMTHILLPFMVLPMYSVMRQIPVSYVRAARSLGAGPLTAFIRVYLPQCIPGLGAGALLVFILALGYYITPALLGGSTDQMISYFVETNMSRSLNWGLASALAAILLGAVLVLYAAYDRLVGANNLKLG
ncbi:MAG: ABC transporter permease subunit [Rhodoferax sp.]|nr:ABC transporter permease subunit [Rhodoferax sp.]